MKISARNQLRGIVETIDLGIVTAKVGVRVGDNLIRVSSLAKALWT